MVVNTGVQTHETLSRVAGIFASAARGALGTPQALLHDCLYAYMHVYINQCKYQWEEFGDQPIGSCSHGPQRTIAASGRKSLLLFDHVITNGQYSHSECDRCLWLHIRGINPLKNVSDNMSRFITNQ